MAVERQTYQESRAGLDLLYNELQKKYDDECLSKQVDAKIVVLFFDENASFVFQGCGNGISVTNRTKK
jgi:hypothetical protein